MAVFGRISAVCFGILVLFCGDFRISAQYVACDARGGGRCGEKAAHVKGVPTETPTHDSVSGSGACLCDWMYYPPGQGGCAWFWCMW